MCGVYGMGVSFEGNGVGLYGVSVVYVVGLMYGVRV